MSVWGADMAAAELWPKLRFWMLVALAGYLLFVMLRLARASRRLDAVERALEREGGSQESSDS